MTTDLPAKIPLHEQLGISYRQLDHYVRRGYLKATSPGSGRDRVFTEQELQVARRMVALIHTGFTVAAAAAYARAQVDKGWFGLLQLDRDGKLTAWGMLREAGYPRYPFARDADSEITDSEEEQPANG